MSASPKRESDPNATGRIEVVIRGDTRRLGRQFRGAEARVDDVAKPRRRDALVRLLDPATVVRKGLGEFDV